MASVYFWLLCALVGVALARVMAAPVRIYQYPNFMAATFAVFILPQAFSLLRFRGAASPWAVEAVLLLACLCLAAAFLARAFPVNRWVVARTTRPIRDDRLFHAGIALIVVGLVANWFQAAVAEELAGGFWTGRVTIYHFFASLLIPGFAIALRTALTRGGPAPWLFTALAAWPLMTAAVLYGRRETAATLVAVVGLTLFYQRRVLPPRAAIAGAIAFTMLIIPATHTYRSLAGNVGLGGLDQLNLVENFAAYVSRSSILELRNAAVLIDITALRESYEYGAGYWDELVWRFVPAQIVGAEVKQGLMLRLSEGAFDNDLWRLGYQMPTGTTITGIGDAFLQFGYVGSLFFLLLGIGIRSLWAASLRPGAAFAQLLYVCTMTAAMRAVTHGTSDYLPGLIYYVIFLGLAVWYAGDRRSASVRTRSRTVSARS